MDQATFQSLNLASHPKTNIVPGETFELITHRALTANDLKDGQVLLETLYISMDPAMRGWIEEGTHSSTQPALNCLSRPIVQTEKGQLNESHLSQYS